MKVIEAKDLVKPQHSLKDESKKGDVVGILKKHLENSNIQLLSKNHDLILFVCNLIENIYKKKWLKKKPKVDKKRIAVQTLETLIGRNYQENERVVVEELIDTMCKNGLVKKIPFSKILISNAISLLSDFL